MTRPVLGALSMARKKGRRKSQFNLKLKKEIYFSLITIFLWLIAGLIIISFSGQGVFLQSIQAYLQTTFGPSMLLIPPVFIFAGLMISGINWKFAKPNVFVGSLILFIGSIGLLRGGTAGFHIFTNLANLLQPLGAFFVTLAISLAGILIMLETALSDFLVAVQRFVLRLIHLLRHRPRALPGSPAKIEMKINNVNTNSIEEDAHEPTPAPAATPAPAKTVAKTDPDTHNSVITSSPQEAIVWEKPPLGLLAPATGGKADRGDIKKNADIIEEVLDSFGIKAKVVEVNGGPAVTQYALSINLGTKLSKITALQNDLALALAAPTGQIRIEAPIPGRSMVGIEIPNRSPEFVTLRTMLGSRDMKKHKSKLAVALGLNVSGQPIVADIASMPHCLIAGATGSGKSVCLNAFITSILFRATPDEVKFILVDPKRVELTGYNDIPHLLTPVIVEPDKVLAALKWAIREMQNRYKVFAEVGVRNIDGYNELSGFQALPYIVIVIDELADIMLFAPGEVEESITKLAQMARATGIHLVLATQRPSVDVITGLIKANITCRLAFNVTSMVDSRVILDGPGAEKLLGKGDMLYIPPSQSKPSRIQGTFISDKEIHELIGYIKSLGIAPQYVEDVTKNAAAAGVGGVAPIEGVDELFMEALSTIISSKKASASLLQRHLKVGYARAARIMDELHLHGVIAASDGTSKPREVLIHSVEDFIARHKS